MNQEIACLQGQFTASGVVSGELVYVGNGLAEDILSARERLQGAVALLDTRSVGECMGGKYVPVNGRVRMACEAGASAVVLISTEDTGGPSMEVIGIPSPSAIPCVMVSRDSGRVLTQAAGEGSSEVRVEASGRSSRGTCANLIADIPAYRASETILLGAHLDTTHNTPGVLDDLSGVVTMMEIARLLAPFRSQFRRNLRLIAYTAEELGFAGSSTWVSEHREELGSIPFVVNFDSLNDATARGTAVMWSPEMRAYISRVFTEAGFSIDVRNFFCMSSDYLPFMLAGVPACRPAAFEAGIPPWSHTPEDDTEHFDPGWIAENARVYGTLLAHLVTDANPLPAAHLSPDGVRRLLEAEQVSESLREFGL